ncbi:hypothetical protein Bca101_084017 [Brassica carinata]
MDPTSNDHQEFEQVEDINDLLEDFWFFDNLLGRRSRILRYCHSDPCPFSPSSPSSSSYPKPEFLKTGDSDSEKKLLEAPPVGDSVPPPCIVKEEGGGEPEKMKKMRRQFSEKIRAQERTTYLQKKEPMVRREKGVKESSKKNRTGNTSCNNKSVKCFPMGGGLQRTQTLPTYIGREDDVNEFHDQESDDSRMGFLIREAIASSSSKFTPTKQITPKISSIPRHRPPRNSRSEEAIQETVVKPQGSKTLRKTLSSIDTKQIMTLKELDITEPEKKDDEEQRRAVKSRSAAVVVGQPIPVWVPKESRRDMKAQIKFWARTVASNVRQEC